METTQLSIQEGNKLIAEFMDLRLLEDGRYEGLYEKGVGIFPPDKLGYNVYWNWLMPVVEKIETVKIPEYKGFTFDIKRNYCAIYCHYFDRHDGAIYQTPYGSNPETKIKAVYDGVIAFIKWYNAN